MNTHPVLGSVSLGRIISCIPRQWACVHAPPYIHTLAFLHSLQLLGFEARLWNARLQGLRKTSLIAGVWMNDEILDWNGNDPRGYIHLYEAFHGGIYHLAGPIDLSPGKKHMAFQAKPVIFELVKEAVDYLHLMHATTQAGGTETARRI